MPAKCAGYKPCSVSNVRRTGLVRKIYKNVTNLQGSGDGQSPTNLPTLDATKGTANFGPLHATGSYNFETYQCGDYSGPVCARNDTSLATGVAFNGHNFDFAGYFCGPWTPRPPVNTFAATAMDALLGVTVVSGGSGYTDGAILSIGLPYTPAGTIYDRAPTFKIHSIAGVIQSATLVDAGSVFIDITTRNSATPLTGGGTGAVFSFTRQDATTDFSSCGYVGWAAVVSRRDWQGVNPLNNPDGVLTVFYTCGACQDWNTTVSPASAFGFEPCRSSSAGFTPNQTKYSHIEINGHYTSTNDADASKNYDVTDSRAFDIDKFSGEKVMSGTDLPSSLPADYDGNTPSSLLGRGIKASLFDGYAFVAFSNVYSDRGLFSGACTGNGTSTLTGVITPLIPDADYESWSADFIGGSFSRAVQQWLSQPNNYYINTAETLTIGATNYEYTKTVTKRNSVGGVIYTMTNVFSVTVALSNPNTYSDVMTDAENNYVSWQLMDRELMPLTTAAWDGIVPKVSRNEVSAGWLTAAPPLQVDDYTHPLSDGTHDPFTTGWVPTWGQRAWFDPRCYLWKLPDGSLTSLAPGIADAVPTALVLVVDGSVLGLPLNLVNEDGIPADYFDPNYLDYENCPPAMGADPGGDWTSTNYLHGYGCWRSAASRNLPPRATQWTNKWEAAKLIFSRHRLSGPPFPGLGGIWTMKNIQTVIKFPAFNHARPFGKDRYAVDETNVACFSAVSAGSPEFNATGGGNYSGTLQSAPLGFATGQEWATFAAGANGVYQIDSVSGRDFTCHYLRDLPDGFDYWDDGSSLTGDTQGILFQLTLPSCPPFGGRLAINSVADNGDGTCTIVTETTPVKMDGVVQSGQVFTVNLCDATMNALASNLTPTTSSLTTFKVTASFATIQNAKWVVLYGALPGDPKVKWATPDETLAAASHPIPMWYWCYDGFAGRHDGLGTMVKAEWTNDFRTTPEAVRTRNWGEWNPFTTYAASADLFDGNGNTWSTSAGGTSGMGYPFPGLPTVSETVTDGSITWTCTGVIGCNYPSLGSTPSNYGYDAAHTTLEDVCKQSGNCGAAYIVCSPNPTDTPPTIQGARYDLIFLSPIDERYGSAQIIDVFQGMADPLYHAPHRACDPNACGGELYPVKPCPPTCVPLVEARSVIQGTIGTAAPDGGGGAALDETATAFVDYTMLNVATNPLGSPNLAFPPSPKTQPDCVYAPTGTFETCP